MCESMVLRNPQLDGAPFYWKGGSTGVLLCHGFTATTAEVRLLAKTLYENGYTVTAPLLPGHGTSPEDCNRFTWQDWYACIEHTYQQLANDCHRVVIGENRRVPCSCYTWQHDIRNQWGFYAMPRRCVLKWDEAAASCYPFWHPSLHRSPSLLLKTIILGRDIPSSR